jgi:transposase
VVGRKNWLFAGSPRGAKASSFFYSLIQTAIENGMNPYGYLKYVFDQAALMNGEINGEKLLPWNIDRGEILNMGFKGLGN